MSSTEAHAGPLTPAHLHELVESGCRPLRGVAARLSTTDFERRTRAGWTVKEMLAHVAFWEETALPLVASFRGHPDVELEAWYHGDVEAYRRDVTGEWAPAAVHNGREAAWARSREPAEVLSRWDAAHGRVLELVDSLSRQELEDGRIVIQLLACSSDHCREHMAELGSSFPDLAGG